MVKPPSKRHSKSGREPVTIDHESTEAKITASPGDGGPFEGSPAGSASSFSETEGSALSGQPERGPATQPGQTHGGAAGTSAQADRPVEDDALIDTHFDAQPQQGESTTPAHSSSDMLHADRQDAATADASSANDFGRSGTDESRLPPDPYDTPEPDVSTPVSDNNSTNRRAGAGIGALLTAAVAGGIISLAGYTALETAGVFGAETDRSAADIQSLRQDVAQLQSEAGAGANAGDIEELRSQVAALQEASGNDGSEQIDALATRVEDLSAQLSQVAENSAPQDLGPITGRLDSLETAVQNATQTQGGFEERFSSLQSSIDSMQSSIATLEQRVEERANDPRLALAITASALKAAIDRGQSFQTELEAYTQAASDPSEVEPLRDMAESGVPTRAAIADSLPQAADAMVAAGRSTPEDGGVFDRLWSSAASVVDVRPVGANVQGNEPAAVVARLEAAVRAGDYARALNEYEALPDASKQAGADFIAKVRARKTADDLVSKALNEALKA